MNGRLCRVGVAEAMSKASSERTLFFFEKPSAMRQLQRFFKSPNTVCVSAEGHLLSAQEPGDVRPEWKLWRFETLPIVLDTIPVCHGKNCSGDHRHRSWARGLNDRVGGAGAPGMAWPGR